MRLLTFALFLVTQFSFSQNYSVTEIPKEMLENADAVVRHHKSTITVEAQDKMRIVTKRVVTVLNENGNEHLNAYAFYEKNDNVSEIEAIVYNGQGEEIKKIKKRDFMDQSAIGNGTLYADSRVLALDYTPIQYPYTIAFTKEYITPNTAFIPSFVFIDDYRVSVELADFTLSMEANIPFRFQERGFGDYPIQSSSTNKSLQYVSKNLKALTYEPMSPSFRDFAPRVDLALNHFHLEGVDGSAKTWEELGHWMFNELLMHQDELDENTIKQINDLVKGIEDPIEKIRKVYGYVQDNTRYISVQLGIGGWQPISAMEVDKVKYGDCKGLTNYTKALLDAVGISSYYTVVYAGSRKRDLDEAFPSMQGNHVILNVPLQEKEVWLECTSQITPVDFLGTFTDNRNVLKVTPEGGKLVRTRAYPDEENYQYTAAEIYLNNNRNITGTATITSTGTQYDQKYWRESYTKLEQEKFYKEHWGYVKGLSIGGVTYTNDKNTVQFTEEVKVDAIGYLTTAGDNLMFAPNVFNRNLAVPDRVRNRKRELVIDRGYLDEDEFTIHLPENYVPETWVQSATEESKFGTYSISITPKGPKSLLYKRKLLIKSGKFPKEDYEAYREFRKKVARYDNSKIILTKKES
ncbi:MAG: DUF3857 domain-containing protein [Allomuricauda sp.]